MAFKSYKTRAYWYSNEAEIETEIVKRQVKTKSGMNPFKYFDGATMRSYQMPPKSMELVYCRRVPEPEECADEIGLDPEVPNFPISNFEVLMSEEGDNAGRGVFTKVDIPEDSYLSAETSCHSIRFMPWTNEILDGMMARFNGTGIDPVIAYMYGYGFTSQYFVSVSVFIVVEILHSNAKLSSSSVSVHEGRTRGYGGLKHYDVCEPWVPRGV